VHINAASYRLLQLVAALDDETPWGAIGRSKRATVAAGFRAAVITASSWIIPTDDLDYDIAIGGLLSLQQKQLPPETISA